MPVASPCKPWAPSTFRPASRSISSWAAKVPAVLKVTAAVEAAAPSSTKPPNPPRSGCSCLLCPTPCFDAARLDECT
jgi:hypothetical protein